MIDHAVLTPIVIKTVKYSGLWNMNPSVSFSGEEIKIYGRATSWVFNPKTNSRGHNSLSTTQPNSPLLETGSHSVVRNQLFSGYLLDSGELSNQIVVLEESAPPCFEDARAFKYKGEDYLIGTWTTQINEFDKSVIKQSMAIYSVYKNTFTLLKSPFLKSTEKNWVPIEVVGDTLIVFYSSQPARILKINLESHHVQVHDLQTHNLGLDFHGRSQLVKLDNSNFLRVASLRLPIKDFGLVHFSFLVEHGPNYEEIRISRPFIFNTLGFEICNGLGRFKNNNLIFTWGCNDKAMYFAKCDIPTIMKWFDSNQIQIKNEKSRNWHKLRGVFRDIEKRHTCECK